VGEAVVLITIVPIHQLEAQVVLVAEVVAQEIALRLFLVQQALEAEAVELPTKQATKLAATVVQVS
jgi:hypothetical protein